MNKSDLKIVFMGTPAFAATCLEKLCGEGYNVVLSVSQPDKPVGRKHILTPPETKVYAQSQGIEVFQPTSMKSEEAYEKIRSCEPDLLITAAYGKILPQSVLDIPKYGCLNVHASLLPKYRGAAPVQYSILNGRRAQSSSCSTTQLRTRRAQSRKRRENSARKSAKFRTKSRPA